MGLAWLDLSTGAFALTPTSEADARRRSGAADAGRDPAARAAAGAPGAVRAVRRLEAGADAAAQCPLRQRGRAPAARKLLRGQGARRVRRVSAAPRSPPPARWSITSALTQQGSGRAHLAPPRRVAPGSVMQIDAATRRNLELMATLAGERRGSLVATIDRTADRRRRAPARRPPRGAADRAGGDRARGSMRCSSLSTAPELRERCASGCAAAPTSSGRLTRLSLGRGGPRDLAALRHALGETAALRRHAGRAGPGAVAGAARRRREQRLGEHGALVDRLAPCARRRAAALRPRRRVSSPPAIRPSSTSCASCATRAAAPSPRCRRAMPSETGVAALRIRHNNVIGYYIEVSARQCRQARRRISSTARRWPGRSATRRPNWPSSKARSPAPPSGRWRWNCASSTISSAR